jgi:hypothetical protein
LQFSVAEYFLDAGTVPVRNSRNNTNPACLGSGEQIQCRFSNRTWFTNSSRPIRVPSSDRFIPGRRRSKRLKKNSRSGCGRRGIRHRRFDGRFTITPAIGSSPAKARATNRTRALGCSHDIRKPQHHGGIQSKPERHAGPNPCHRHAAFPPRESERGLCRDLVESVKTGSLRMPHEYWACGGAT